MKKIHYEANYKYLIIGGLILIIAGIVFQLQSVSLFGPSSSFMYANPEWTYNGLIIIVIGLSILVFGIIAIKVNKKDIKE